MKKSIKKFFCGFLTVIMLLSVVPMTNNLLDFSINASAEGLASTGQCGENVFWVFDSESGLLTINGTGEMYDYLGTDSPFDKKSIKTIVINDGVTTIGNYAFAYSNVTNVTILGNNLKKIGKWAFFWCIHLQGITIPESVKDIGEYAFQDCQSLSSIEIPNGIENISTGTFKNCTLLKSVTIPKSVTTIGEYAFGSCRNLASVTIPDNVIDLSGFGNCSYR